MKPRLTILSAACTLFSATPLAQAQGDFEQTLPSSDAVANNSADLALTLGGRYYAETPDDGPEWGLRFAVIFLFPRS